MLIVNASYLVEVVCRTPRAEQIHERTYADGELAAPQVIDVEVMSIIRRNIWAERWMKRLPTWL